MALAVVVELSQILFLDILGYIVNNFLKMITMDLEYL